MTAARGLPLRTQVLLAVLGGAILPLALVGIWLTASAVRSGEALLRSHLDTSADRMAAAIETRWRFREADLALVAGNVATLRAVGEAGMTAADSAYLLQLAFDLGPTIPVVELRDLAGQRRWGSDPASRQSSGPPRQVVGAPPLAPQTGPRLRVELPIMDDTGTRRGTAVTEVAVSALLPADSARPVVPGALVALRRTGDTATLLALSGRLAFPDSSRFQLADTTWLAERRVLPAPGLELGMAAPLAPYVDPFARAARIGVVALVAVALLAMLVVAGLATRAIRPLATLAQAADAVAAGALDQEVAVAGPREVRHVGTAFNVMTERLRQTLDELTRRSALAAVGEFATSLSHDVRNALTAIKVDLERADRRELADPVARGLVTRAVNNVVRLESVVTGALRVARSGHAPQETLDLRAPIREAAAMVVPTLTAQGARLHLEVSAAPVLVRGDHPALQQLFGNLLFNAAQAIRPGGEIRVSLEPSATDIAVRIADDGIGIPPETMTRLGSPGVASRPGGTGLGIPIARRIAAAHGGGLDIESSEGRGTTVVVRLPRVNTLSTEGEQAVTAAPAPAAKESGLTSSAIVG